MEPCHGAVAYGSVAQPHGAPVVVPADGRPTTTEKPCGGTTAVVPPPAVTDHGPPAPKPTKRRWLHAREHLSSAEFARDPIDPKDARPDDVVQYYSKHGGWRLGTVLPPEKGQPAGILRVRPVSGPRRVEKTKRADVRNAWRDNWKEPETW